MAKHKSTPSWFWPLIVGVPAILLAVLVKCT